MPNKESGLVKTQVVSTDAKWEKVLAAAIRSFEGKAGTKSQQKVTLERILNIEFKNPDHELVLAELVKQYPKSVSLDTLSQTIPRLKYDYPPSVRAVLIAYLNEINAKLEQGDVPAIIDRMNNGTYKLFLIIK